MLILNRGDTLSQVFQKNWFSYVTIIFKLLRQCLSFFFGHTCRVNFAGALWTGPWHGKTYQREFFALKHMYIFLYYIRTRFTSLSLIVTQTLRLLRPIFICDIFANSQYTVSWNDLTINFHPFYSCHYLCLSFIWSWLKSHWSMKIKSIFFFNFTTYRGWQGRDTDRENPKSPKMDLTTQKLSYYIILAHLDRLYGRYVTYIEKWR